VIMRWHVASLRLLAPLLREVSAETASVWGVLA
jgi:hypothetical protein